MRAGRTRSCRPAAGARSGTPLRALVVVLALVAGARGAAAVEETPTELQGVGVEERLGTHVDLNLTFVAQDGRTVRLGDYFGDDKPVLLTLNYYTCTALCNLHLNGLVESLRSFDWKPGDEYRIVTVSINPKEDAALARGKRANYLKALEKGEDVDWSFLTVVRGPDGRPSATNVKKLAASVGFGYRYDPDSDQYAHAAVTMFLSPEGKVARYLYGIDLPVRDVKFALMEAAEGRVGSTIDKILLTCFHYDETAGRYGAYAFGIMRLGAGLTLLAVGMLLLVMWRRERSRRSQPREPAPESPRESAPGAVPEPRNGSAGRETDVLQASGYDR